MSRKRQSATLSAHISQHATLDSQRTFISIGEVRNGYASQKLICGLTNRTTSTRPGQAGSFEGRLDADGAIRTILNLSFRAWRSGLCPSQVAYGWGPEANILEGVDLRQPRQRYGHQGDWPCCTHIAIRVVVGCAVSGVR